MGGSCKLFSNRSQAAGITSETAAAAAPAARRKGGARWTPQESQAPARCECSRRRGAAGGRWTTTAGPGRCGCSCSWRWCLRSGAKVSAGSGAEPSRAGQRTDGRTGGRAAAAPRSPLRRRRSRARLCPRG